jgi:ABC-type multidrug transport system ATPase subunit
MKRVIRECFPNTTVISIAHRLATIIDCDRVLVLERGEVMDFDTPEALLQKPPTRSLRKWPWRLASRNSSNWYNEPRNYNKMHLSLLASTYGPRIKIFHNFFRFQVRGYQNGAIHLNFTYSSIYRNKKRHHAFSGSLFCVHTLINQSRNFACSTCFS